MTENQFEALGLSEVMLRAVEEMGYEKPMPVQEQVIPVLLREQEDVVALAPTGTGKTAAFGLPLLQLTDVSNRRPQSLILSPTRELCLQIARDLEGFAKSIKGLSVVPVYGGASMDVQIRALAKGAHVIVATPGRMNDLLRRGKINTEGISIVVLDEADEMLNMGFREELDAILESMPEERRTLLFSATMPREVAAISKGYMKNPKELVIGERNKSSSSVNHVYYPTMAKDQYAALCRVIDNNPGIYGIIFCQTRQNTRDISTKLIRDGYRADALHGELSQSIRELVMERFHQGHTRLLVATDVAARGIDVDSLTHVINYNLPDDPEVYTHRSGRTGRAGRTGTSVAIIHTREMRKLQVIERFTGRKFEHGKLPTGEEVCATQLHNLFDRIEQVKVDDPQIDDFMPAILEKMEGLSREDIIRKFVSMEFNRFLEQYRNAPDLNVKDRPERRSREEGRDGGSRGERRSSRGGDFARFFISVGSRDGLMPARLIGMINDATGCRDISIGSIDILKGFSFFEVEKSSAASVLNKLNGFDWNDRIVKVEEASAKTGGGGKSSRSGGGYRGEGGGYRGEGGGYRGESGGSRGEGGGYRGESGGSRGEGGKSSYKGNRRQDGWKKDGRRDGGGSRDGGSRYGGRKNDKY